MFLGNVVAAKSALMYVVKYLAKDRAALTNILSIFVSAHDHILRHPSVAADVGTEIRTAQHWLTRTLNSVSGHVEYPAQIAAAAVMGLPAEIWSHTFWFAFVLPAIAHCKQVHEQHPPAALVEDVGSLPNVFPSDPLDEDVDVAFSGGEAQSAEPADDQGQAEIAQQPGGGVAVCEQHLHEVLRWLPFASTSTVGSFQS